jgi:3-deoxy-D-manno-octulosonate 8-phosphate phosphatase (KDO 8-P phosphatase)
MNFKVRLNKVSTFIFSVNGVLTGEKFFLSGNEQIRSLNSKDTFALMCALEKGYRVAFISSGPSSPVKTYLEQMGITELFFSQQNKLDCYKNFIATHNISEQEIVYMGDDLQDLEVMKRAAVPVCPADAAPQIRELCVYFSQKRGGEGCVRDIIEQVLRLHGKWII